MNEAIKPIPQMVPGILIVEAQEKDSKLSNSPKTNNDGPFPRLNNLALESGKLSRTSDSGRRSTVPQKTRH